MLYTHQIQDARPQATAHLAKTMSYLQLPAAELEAALLTEIDRNPALELVDELRCPGCGRKLRQAPCPSCAAPSSDDAPIVYLSPREPGRYTAADADRYDRPEAGAPERLDEFIMRQIGPALPAEDRALAVYILALLDEDGLLQEAPAEIAALRRVSLRRVERVLDLIQHAEPAGVGARTAQQCLLLQLEALEDRPDQPRSQMALARLLIRDHFDELGGIEYERIARRIRAEHGMQLPAGAVSAAIEYIHRNLTPYPARAYWGEGKAQANSDGAAMSVPDINITTLHSEQGSGLAVEVYTPLSGWLRVNPDFKAAVAECTGEERERWQQTVAEAALVTKCLQQRNHTMRRLMEILARGQRDFILGGDCDLRPTTRVQIAQALGLHESTISRAVAGKSVALPNGRIIPLAKFFDRSLSVRDRVRSLIAAETRALTDDEIAIALAEEGIQVARRTVAKYRKMLGILPANVRGRQARLQKGRVAQTGCQPAASISPQ
jgi:RNA polymerase sigma-54 factor